MQHTKTAKLIFPHQLFEYNPLFTAHDELYLVEEHLFFKQYNFHKQKIAFHRATMKYYENHLNQKNIEVKYIQAHQPQADIRTLIADLHAMGIDKIIIVDPTDYLLSRRINIACKKWNISLEILPSPMFLNTQTDLETFFLSTKKKFFQTEFYKQQRISRKILTDQHNQPAGGQWTYDVENRKKYPKNKPVAEYHFPKTNQYSTEAHAYVNQYFKDNIGQLSTQINYPIGFEESQHWLNTFLKTRFAEFGHYEDAIVTDQLLLNHSLLTPMLNIGTLTPKQIIDEALIYAQKHDTPINSLEGFVRQIVGWREFIRGVYVAKGSQQRTKNYWKFNKPIPQSFYDGTTGILPIDDTIKKILKTGYCHHIERLMVLGNFMLLCEFDPDEVHRWFMELFIDAYDWVMVPNVYGMSQFADGGLMSTKPYVSGSNYIMNMSNYPKGDWQTTWDALFWRFLDTQRTFFLKNPRLGMLVRTFDKWDEHKKQTTHSRANQYLEKMYS